MALKLPETEQVPVLEGMPSDLSMIVFGPPKVGKTTFGASFPKSVLLECEQGGAQYVKGRVMEINSLEELREAYDLIKANPGYCETVIIDTLDRVVQWIEADICKSMGIQSIGESKKGEKYGAQWGLYAERVLGLLAGWKLLGKRVVFLAHTKKAEMDGNGLVINPKTINLYGQTAGRVIAIVDNVGHLYTREGGDGKPERILSFAPSVNVEAGARHPALNGKMIPLPLVGMYEAFSGMFGQASDKKANGHKTTKTKEALPA